MFEDGKWAKWKGAGTGFVGRRRVWHGNKVVPYCVYKYIYNIYNIKAAIVQ